MISYNQAIARTINLEPKSPPLGKCRRCCTSVSGRLGLFQLLLVVAIILYKATITPVLYGIGFLTKPAHHFECLNDGDGSWEPCTQEKICEDDIGSDHYRPVKDDEYIDGWVSADKFDLLCESKFKIGFIGSAFFLGVISTILVIPPLSDKVYGRKTILRIGFIIYTAALLGLLVSNNIYELYVFLFVLGTTFSIQVVIGLTFLIEFMPERYQKPMVFIFLIFEPVAIILLTLWY